MSNDNVFEKKYVANDAMSNVEGLLEHFNLPPKVISFIRKNVRAIQIGSAVVVIAVVAFSLYGSYREKRIEEASSALTLALEQKAEQQQIALQKVTTDYSGTMAAVWARVEIAHNYMDEKKYDDAQKMYNLVATKAGKKNPLRPLALLGEAQAFEFLGKYENTRQIYKELKELTGYKDLSFMGIARSWEVEGNIENAITTYNEYLMTMEGTQPQAKAYIESKVVRLKTIK